MQSMAKEEGQVNLVIWPGYADKSWTDTFTANSGCKVNTKDGATSDDMIDLLASGEYDGLSASGNASVRLMAKGDVSAVNTDLLPNYADVIEGIKNQSYNSKDGEPYGAPHGRGPNLLVFRTDEVTETTDSWAPVWDGSLLRQVVDLRRLDLHRRRSRVPDGDPARPRDRESVPAERGAVRGCGRAAQEARADRRRVVGGLREADPVDHQQGQRHRHDVAVPGQHPRSRTSSR